LVDLLLADSGDVVMHEGGRGDLRPDDARPTDVRDTVSARSSSPQFPSSSGTDMAIKYILGGDGWLCNWFRSVPNVIGRKRYQDEMDATTPSSAQ
jgi:hypothetical protein